MPAASQVSHEHDHSLHRIRSDSASFVWDNSIAPVLEIESGETVELETADASGGQLTADSTPADVAALDFDRVNPVTGPVFVQAARSPATCSPSRSSSCVPTTWGWTAIIPGFGLLADEFTEPWLRISEVDAASRPRSVRRRHHASVRSVPGHDRRRTRRARAALDRPAAPLGRQHGHQAPAPGSTLYLPVGVEGALFSVGDTHAAMGDGEVCGTAVETAMDIAVRLTVRQDLSDRYPQYEIPPGQLARGEASGYHVCTGIGADLMEAVREAIRATRRAHRAAHGRDRQEAYAIASVAADLRIHEVVDVPNWVVGAFLPHAIFD